MKRILVMAWLVITSASTLKAQVQLPDLYFYHYAMAQRDPFISPDAPTTLITSSREIHGIFSGDLVRQYLERVIQLIKDDLYVGGISIGDTPFESMALINGIGFHVGDKFPLEATKTEVQGIQQLTASYGLPVVTDDKGSLMLEVGRITECGVDLVLPGFKAAIYQLPLPRDVPPTTIELEKKKRKPRISN